MVVACTKHYFNCVTCLKISYININQNKRFHIGVTMLTSVQITYTVTCSQAVSISKSKMDKFYFL